MNKLDNLLKEALENDSKIQENLKFINDNIELLTEEQRVELGKIKYKIKDELIPEIEKLEKHKNND